MAPAPNPIGHVLTWTKEAEVWAYVMSRAGMAGTGESSSVGGLMSHGHSGADSPGWQSAEKAPRRNFSVAKAWHRGSPDRRR